MNVPNFRHMLESRFKIAEKNGKMDEKYNEMAKQKNDISFFRIHFFSYFFMLKSKSLDLDTT